MLRVLRRVRSTYIKLSILHYDYIHFNINYRFYTIKILILKSTYIILSILRNLYVTYQPGGGLVIQRWLRGDWEEPRITQSPITPLTPIYLDIWCFSIARVRRAIRAVLGHRLHVLGHRLHMLGLLRLANLGWKRWSVIGWFWTPFNHLSITSQSSPP